MGLAKRYLNHLICTCVPDNDLAQNAIEHAINEGTVDATFNLEADTKKIMDHYDEIIEDYHELIQAHRAARLRRIGIRIGPPPNHES